jgi:hypothetical protein
MGCRYWHIKACLLFIFRLSFCLSLQGQVSITPEFSESKAGFQATVLMISPLQFGDFYPSGGGGEVIVSSNGTRTSTGSVILLPSGQISSAGVLEIRALPKRMMQIHLSESVWLQGSNGGKLRLYPGPLSTGNVFVTPPGAPSGFTLTMGGRLQLSSLQVNPSGSYTGSIYITLISQ